MEIEEKTVMESVKSLRAAMKLSQVSFAARLGKSYPTVQRYENVVAPKGPELATLVYMAREAGRSDLARIFKSAAIEAVPEELVKLIREGDVDGPDTEEAAADRKGHKRKIPA